MSLLTSLDALLNQRYEEAMDYVYLKYHTYESPLPDPHLTEGQVEEISFFDAMGRICANNSGNVNSSQRPKSIIFDRDPDFLNGLPRKKRF